MEEPRGLDRTVICQTLDKSKKKIRKLYQDGSCLVKNVQTASDAREVLRRRRKQLFDSERKKQLEKEIHDSKIKYLEVMKKWESVKTINISDRMYQLFLEQKKACDQLVSEKDQAILSLMQELQQKDQEFLLELQKQEENSSTVSKRIDQLIDQMTLLCRKELLSIRNVYESEYEKLVEELEADCTSRILDVHREAVKEQEERADLVKHYQEAVLNVEKRTMEEFSHLRTKLDNEIHNLETEVQRIKGVQLLNQEKLEMNLQVLRKQQEENGWLRVEQKRQVMHLHDVTMQQKRNLESTQEKGKMRIQKLATETQRLQEKVKASLEYIKNVLRSNVDDYMGVWLTKEEEIRALFHKVMDSRRFISEEILLAEWHPPEADFLKNLGPIYLDDLPKHTQNASEGPESVNPSRCLTQSLGEPNFASEISDEQILEIFATDLEFLLERQENDGGSTLQEKVSGLDSLLKRLNIQSAADMELLRNCFMKTVTAENKGDFFDANVAKAAKEYVAVIQEAANHKHKRHDNLDSVRRIHHNACKEYWSLYESTAMCDMENQSLTIAFTSLGKYLSILIAYQDLVSKKDKLLNQNQQLSYMLG